MRPSRLSRTANEAAELSAEGTVDERLSGARDLIEAPFANGGNRGVLAVEKRIGANEPQPGYVRAFGVANFPPDRFGAFESTDSVSIRVRTILTTPGDRGSRVLRAGQRRYERWAEDTREMADKVCTAGRGHDAILFRTRPAPVVQAQ